MVVNLYPMDNTIGFVKTLIQWINNDLSHGWWIAKLFEDCGPGRQVWIELPLGSLNKVGVLACEPYGPLLSKGLLQGRIKKRESTSQTLTCTIG